MQLYSSNSEVKAQYSSLNNYNVVNIDIFLNSSFISHSGYSTTKCLSSLFLVRSADGVAVCTYQIKQFILFRNICTCYPVENDLFLCNIKYLNNNKYRHQFFPGHYL